VTFVASAKNIGDIQQYISQVVRNINCEPTSQSGHLPTVIVIDNLHHIASLADVFSSFVSAKSAAWFVVFTGHCILKLFFKCYINPLIAILKLQSNGASYSNTVIGTLAIDGCAVTFGTVRRGLGEAAAQPGPSSLYQM